MFKPTTSSHSSNNFVNQYSIQNQKSLIKGQVSNALKEWLNDEDTQKPNVVAKIHLLETLSTLDNNTPDIDNIFPSLIKTLWKKPQDVINAIDKSIQRDDIIQIIKDVVSDIISEWSPSSQNSPS